MASNQLSNKKHKPTGKQTSAGRPDSTSQQGGQKNYGAMQEPSREESDRDEQGYIQQGVAEMEECTREHAGTAVLVSLAAGFGIGLTIGCALAMPHRPKTWRDRLTAEGIGRDLLNRLEGMIPEALAEYVRK